MVSSRWKLARLAALMIMIVYGSGGIGGGGSVSGGLMAMMVYDMVGEECAFTVDASKAGGSGALAVTVDGPSKVQLHCQPPNTAAASAGSGVSGGYRFTYRPLVAGVYMVSVKYAGDSHIPGSPFHVNVTPGASLSTGSVLTEYIFSTAGLIINLKSSIVFSKMRMITFVHLTTVTVMTNVTSFEFCR